jgi:hypothetical protein
MERAVQASRYTLAVLSPQYLKSGFTELENVLAEHLGLERAERRLLAVMYERARPRQNLKKWGRHHYWSPDGSKISGAVVWKGGRFVVDGKHWLPDKNIGNAVGVYRSVITVRAKTFSTYDVVGGFLKRNPGNREPRMTFKVGSLEYRYLRVRNRIADCFIGPGDPRSGHRELTWHENHGSNGRAEPGRCGMIYPGLEAPDTSGACR